MTWEKIISEIFGTGTLILLGDGVVAGVLLTKTKAQNSGWIVITFAWAMAVFAGVVVGGPISGAHINPAVTFSLAIEHTLDPKLGIGWDQVPGYWLGQMVGAFLGACLVALHYWDHFKATEDANLKLAVFSTAPNIRNYPLNLISEIIGTFVLVFVLFFMVFAKNVPIGSLGIALSVGLLVLAIGLSLGGTTGYAINPARDLGPRIAHYLLPIPGKRDSDWAYSWVPVVGPLIGGALAAIVYYAVFVNWALKVVS